MSEGARRVATPSQTIGPFFHFALAADGARGCLAAPSVPGERIWLRIRVLDGEGLPVPDALVELYHADAQGRYPDPGRTDAFAGFGRLPTMEDGACVFETVRPGPVAGPAGRRQAAHIDVCLLARGLLRHVYTRIYFEGDPWQDEDPVLALVPVHRRRTLMAARVEGLEPPAGVPPASPGALAAARWEFVLRLQGEHETVLFDL